MSRTEEVKSNINIIDEGIKEISSIKLTQEQVTNLNLSAIVQNLADINVTLAMIADQLTYQR